MLVRGLKNFSTLRYGEVTEGLEFDCEPWLAEQWAAAGNVEIIDNSYDTKVVDEAPRTTSRQRAKAGKD